MLEQTDFLKIASAKLNEYHNQVVSNVNDHVVRVAVMIAPYPWHYHPDSDETFIGMEGSVIIETFDGVYELTPGSCITIPKGVAHCTRPKHQRSVNLTVESAGINTIMLSDAEVQAKVISKKQH